MKIFTSNKIFTIGFYIFFGIAIIFAILYVIFPGSHLNVFIAPCTSLSMVFIISNILDLKRIVTKLLNHEYLDNFAILDAIYDYDKSQYNELLDKAIDKLEKKEIKNILEKGDLKTYKQLQNNEITIKQAYKQSLKRKCDYYAAAYQLGQLENTVIIDQTLKYASGSKVDLTSINKLFK